MRTAELLNAMAAWLASPNNEAMLLAQEDETCMKVVAESCVLASELLRNAAEEVALEPQEASLITTEAIEETAALAAAFDATNDPELKKMASVLDELLLTISASPTALADKKSGNDARIEELKRKYNGPREVLNEMNNRAEDVKAINKSKMTDQYKIQGHLLSARSCPLHAGAQLQRVGENIYRCQLDGDALGYDLNGEHVPGGSVDQQTKSMYNENNMHTIFDNRSARLGINE